MTTGDGLLAVLAILGVYALWAVIRALPHLWALRGGGR